MRCYKCMKCKRISYFKENLVMKICYCCQEPVIITEDKKEEKRDGEIRKL